MVYRLLNYENNFKKNFGFSISSLFIDLKNKNNYFQIPIYETCVKIQTLENLNFWNSLSTTTIITILLILFSIIGLFTFRAFYLRFYIWHETKIRQFFIQK